MDENIQNVSESVQKVFDMIIRSEEQFPRQLRSLCLYQTINARFPNNGLASIGKILFLRLFNSTIGSCSIILSNHVSF
jgi:hypothetical protein